MDSSVQSSVGRICNHFWDAGAIGVLWKNTTKVQPDVSFMSFGHPVSLSGRYDLAAVVWEAWLKRHFRPLHQSPGSLSFRQAGIENARLFLDSIPESFGDGNDVGTSLVGTKRAA